MDIDISIVRKGSDMEKTTLDMQASLNPQGGIALFSKAQDKSSRRESTWPEYII